MSNPSNCCTPACTDTELIQVPGVQGEPGAAGTAGVNAFTVTTASITLPGSAGPVTVPPVQTFANTSWMAVGQKLFISDGVDFGFFQVLTIPSATGATLSWLDYRGDAAGASVIGSGAQVSPAGTQPPLAASLPTAFTDNTTGAASDTLAAGTGRFLFVLPVNLASITGAGDVLTNIVFGFKFKIISEAFAVTVPVTTGGKGITLNSEIGTTNVTGSAIVLTSANCTPLGAVVAGGTITAANTGSASDTFSIEAASVTAFSEGAGVYLAVIQNMDSADAMASLADHVNSLITALT